MILKIRPEYRQTAIELLSLKPFEFRKARLCLADADLPLTSQKLAHYQNSLAQAIESGKAVWKTAAATITVTDESTAFASPMAIDVR